MTIGFLTWANPLWALAALAALAAPLIAHLLSRHVARSAIFPTIRFLRLAMDESRRRSRWRDLLLLLLRSAALLLVVAAFARPSWTATDAASPAAGIDAILLIDRSASMTRASKGASLLDDAKRRAIDAIRSLDSRHDRAAVVWIDGDPAPLLPELSANVAALAERVGQAAPTFQRGRVEEALRQASLLAAAGRDHPGRGKGGDRQLRITLMSDFQASQWPSRRAVAAALPADASIDWQTMGKDDGNVALHRPTVTPALPTVGQPAEVNVELSHFGGRELPARTVVVQLQFEGATLSQQVDLPAGAALAVRFVVVPRRPGLAKVECIAQSRPGDGLRADDRAGLYFRVIESRPVLLVSRADAASAKTTTFFLQRALAPSGAAGAGVANDIANVRAIAPGRLREIVDATALTASATGALPVVMLADAGELDAEAGASLHRFLSRGGSVVWLLDSQGAAEAFSRLNRALNAAAGPALTWRPLPASIRSAQFDHPVLRIFSGAARSELLAARFAGAAAGKLDDAWQPLMWADDGSPLLALRPVGAGRLAVWAADLSPAGGDFVKGPLFAPLIHQLLHHVAPGPPPRTNPPPGSRVALSSGDVPASAARLRGPEGAADPDDLRTVSHAMEFMATAPGAYELTTGSGAAMALLDGTFVELDPIESDTRSDLEPAATVDTASAASSNASAAAAGAHVRSVELWPWCVAAAAALLLLESLVTIGVHRRARQANSLLMDRSASVELS